MIDERKVLRMTKMAFYEGHGGKDDKATAGYFKGDYISLHLLISTIVLTLGFLLAFGGYLAFHFEEFLSDIYTLDLLALAKDVLVRYLVVLAAYLLVTFLVYRARYNKARRRLNAFLKHLEALDGEDKEA